MSRKVSLNLHTIDELDGPATDHAIETLRHMPVIDSFWHEHCTRVASSSQLGPGLFQSLAEKHGVTLERFFFSGFASQGDGASFEAWVDYEEYILKNKLGNEYRALLNHARAHGANARVVTTGRYCHSNTMVLDAVTDHFSPLSETKRAHDAAAVAERQAERLESRILSRCKSLADDFYRMLESEYFDLTSDEGVLEYIHAQENEFLSNGTLFDFYQHEEALV